LIHFYKRVKKNVLKYCAANKDWKQYVECGRTDL